MLSIATLFNYCTQMFGKLGENDDEEVARHEASPDTTELLVYQYQGSRNIWRKCVRKEAPHWWAKSELEKWLNTFADPSLCHLFGHKMGGEIFLSGRAVPVSVDGPWFEDGDLIAMPWWYRPATADETLGLPDVAESEWGVYWHNFTEDPRKYFVSFGKAYVVPENFWEACKSNGVLCHKGKDGNFYIGL